MLAAVHLAPPPMLPAPTTPPAAAIDHSQGLPGFCPTSVGVTVVVDFQDLGGTAIVRCNPRATRGTGLDALKGAGFQIEGVQRWGEAFICRIENRPSAVETVAIAGNSGYRERCIDTPPASGYWSYWHAGNNCAWNYSQWGVKNRDFVPGGFEGWSFSLNATPDDNPEPRVAAVRPGTEGGACDEPYEPPPTSNDPGERQPGATGSSGRGGSGSSGGGSGSHSRDEGSGSLGEGSGRSSDGGSTGSQGGEAPSPSGDLDPGGDPAGDPDRDLPVPRRREATEAPDPPDGDTSSTEAASPDDDVAFTGGEDERDVREVIREQSGASPLAPFVAAGVVVALSGGIWWTARRRKSALEG